MSKRYEHVTVIAEKPIAVDSPDHICPVGAKNDNTTNTWYIEEVMEYLNRENLGTNVMDIGCAGGQLAVDFSHRGCFSIGIEGSSYPVDNKRENWKNYHKTILHTADVTKPYYVQKSGEKVLFDLISAWEVVEHIHPNDLDAFFDNVLSNLKPNGIFVASINTSEDVRVLPDGSTIQIHQSVFSKETWLDKILADRNVVPYPFRHSVRTGPSSFHIGMKRKENE